MPSTSTATERAAEATGRIAASGDCRSCAPLEADKMRGQSLRSLADQTAGHAFVKETQEAKIF
jgi:hypothetical protein